MLEQSPWSVECIFAHQLFRFFRNLPANRFLSISQVEFNTYLRPVANKKSKFYNVWIFQSLTHHRIWAPWANRPRSLKMENSFWSQHHVASKSDVLLGSSDGLRKSEDISIHKHFCRYWVRPTVYFSVPPSYNDDIFKCWCSNLLGAFLCQRGK